MDFLQTKRTWKRQAEQGICRATPVIYAVYIEVRLEIRELQTGRQETITK
jgi:hypothetical protein